MVEWPRQHLFIDVARFRASRFFTAEASCNLLPGRDHASQSFRPSPRRFRGRERGLRGTMVFLLFDQMHGEIVGFVQHKVGLSTGRAPCEFERRHWRD